LRAALGPALFGRPLLRFCGRTSPQVPPDASANQEEGEPRRRGHEYLDDPLDPIGLPERRDGEREDNSHAQRGKDCRNRYRANPCHQAQAPGTHPAPLRTRLAKVSSITQHYTPERTKSTGEQTPPRPSPHRPSSVLDKRSQMCKLLVWQHPIKSLHSRTHTTSSNEGRRPHGTFLWVRGVRRWGRSAGS
jgi:hypothetical protein